MQLNKSYVKSEKDIPRANEGVLTKLIDEQIEWYDKNSVRYDDDYIKAHLKLIKNLAENIENSNDIMFIEKIIKTMCEILEVQRDVIDTLESELKSQSTYASAPQINNYLSSVSADEITNDEQLKALLLNYMINKEEMSSYTANDYALRIQNLWRSFYTAYENEELPDELIDEVKENGVQPDAPLLNAYNYIDELNCYVSMKIAADSSNRNSANVRAALNKFYEAIYGEKNRKLKLEPKQIAPKDFSKYLFKDNIYGKSRLVLAVVKQYVEDYHPSTFDELREAFPDELQGSFGVVRRIEDVSDKYKGIAGVKRYFVGENEILHLTSGERVIVCTQFGAQNTEKFVEHAMYVLRYEIEKVLNI